MLSARRSWKGSFETLVAGAAPRCPAWRDLRERYDIATNRPEPGLGCAVSGVAVLPAAARGNPRRREPNVIVFYVDTLRADVARDPARHAEYASGSPANLGVSERVHHRIGYASRAPGDHGRQLRSLSTPAQRPAAGGPRRGVPLVLLWRKSAHEFSIEAPAGVRFEDTVKVPDYAPGNENVWGYGADQPAAAHLVDRSLDWNREHARAGSFSGRSIRSPQLGAR